MNASSTYSENNFQSSKPPFPSLLPHPPDNRPPEMVPAKVTYMDTDLSRLAKYYQIPIKIPAVSSYQL